MNGISEYPKVDELCPLLVLGDGHYLNGNIVDDESLEVLLRIERTMQRLEVMGDDDKRYMWIELQGSEDEEDWDEEPDANGRLWYHLLTANYRGFHYLVLSNDEGRFVDLRSAHHIGAERSREDGFFDVKEPLLILERYVETLVGLIVGDAEAYNDYVERNLPYRKREGVIRRSVLYDICPHFREFEHPQQYIDMLRAMSGMALRQFQVMTLRIYTHYWRIAYEAYVTERRFEPCQSDAFEGLSDEEMFRRYSSQGYDLKGLDLDSEADYVKWEDENNCYHCNDVAYARIHLWAERDESGLWHFTLGYHGTGFLGSVLNIVSEFHRQGIGIDISSFCDEAIARLSESDEIEFTPMPSKYRNEAWLPWPDEQTTEAMVQEIIRRTEWKPQARVAPIKRA